MKSFVPIILAALLGPAAAIAGTHTVTNVENVFTPATITIDEGDTVVFSIGLDHNAAEVSQTTWDSNGTAPLAGGFYAGFGGGTVTGLAAGTHYYVCQPHAEFGMKGRIIVNPVTDAGPTAGRTPARFSLAQNFPNPFNPSTTIEYSVAERSTALITVYDGLGRRVRTLVSGEMGPGTYTTVWDGSTEGGFPAVSGTYFIRMTAGNGKDDFSAVRRILLVR